MSAAQPADPSQPHLTLQGRPDGHPEASLIRPHLLLGSIYDAVDGDLLGRLGVTHVLNISKKRYEVQIACEVMHIDVDDEIGEHIVQYFPPTVDFISKATQQPGNRVLVHCDWGVSRSATLVVAYIMQSERLGAADALRSTRQNREICFMCPDRNFLRALSSWEAAFGRVPPNVEDLVAVTGEFGASVAAAEVDELTLEIPDGGKEKGNVEWPDAIIRHKNKIAEDILTLHCPACSQAFFDFTNCFALWCSRCDTAFCAYCQYNCRNEHNDAHSHVMRCKYNIAPNRSIFADFRIFELAQNLRRVRDVRSYADSITNAETRATILCAIKRDVEDLGIKTVSVSRAEWLINCKTRS